MDVEHLQTTVDHSCLVTGDQSCPEIVGDNCHEDGDVDNNHLVAVCGNCHVQVVDDRHMIVYDSHHLSLVHCIVVLEWVGDTEVSSSYYFFLVSCKQRRKMIQTTRSYQVK